MFRRWLIICFAFAFLPDAVIHQTTEQGGTAAGDRHGDIQPDVLQDVLYPGNPGQPGYDEYAVDDGTKEGVLVVRPEDAERERAGMLGVIGVVPGYDEYTEGEQGKSTECA